MERDGVERLLAAAGVDGRRLRHALTLLCDGQWWTLADLVRQSATSRRTIEELLRELSLERSGDRFRVPPGHSPDYQDLLAVAPPPEDPVAHLLPHYGPVLERLRELIAKAPRARHTLDHVAATPDTVLRRALLLGARFWLPGARLLCVGDHDLTSLAVKLRPPGDGRHGGRRRRAHPRLHRRAGPGRTHPLGGPAPGPAPVGPRPRPGPHRPAVHAGGRRAVRRPRDRGPQGRRADPAGLRRERAHPGAGPQGAELPVRAEPNL